MPPHDLAQAQEQLRQLAERWHGVAVSERAAFQSWALEFCDALGVDRPTPPTPDYQFELPVAVTTRDGDTTTNFIDLWKRGHFALEAKATDVQDGNDKPLRKAFGQVRNYVAHVSGTAPPFLMTVDVPRTLIIWDGWNGDYGGFPAGRRIPLATLHTRPDDIRLLQDIWTNPAVRDPRGRAQAVTREIAGSLADLAATFEGRGHDPEQVARFLMRCVFCFFAEDVELLPRGLFRRTLETARTAGGPDRVAQVLTTLWQTMDEGGSFGADLIHRFNGHFFKSHTALPLEPGDVALLVTAAEHDWSRVEPSIFGTLLVRALDAVERHRLGAEYTPREYIERLVEPTVVEPLRDRWTAVQGVVLQLSDTRGKRAAQIKKDREAAVKELRGYHAWLRGLRFLDPACGSGNFLYVTMAAVKRIELEVLSEIERLGRDDKKGTHEGQFEQVLEEVHPRQFHGIEVKPWAREIAELTLWIGYHQFWRETHGGRTPPDPILEDTGTIECRDAVLAWDEIVRRPERDRPDPTPRIPNPVTGELVPDPAARLPYYEYVGARQAEWPEADFIVGNPPYVGNARMRDVLGDGYTESLRGAYPEVPEGVDFVMYWWFRGARAVARRHALRSGLLTTNSIVQPLNRRMLTHPDISPARVSWVVRDHPWVDEVDGAAVRVSMTVVSFSPNLIEVVTVDDGGQLLGAVMVTELNPDLTAHADVATASATPLAANRGLSYRGVALVGDGFLVPHDQVDALAAAADAHFEVLRPIRNGRDLTDRSRNLWVIDFGLRTEAEARAFPILYDIVRTRVKPAREAQADEGRRRTWWRFGRSNVDLREGMGSLARFTTTPMTSKHRFFTYLDTRIIPDQGLIAICLDDSSVLGTLSSAIHIAWALVAGGTLEDRPRYNNLRCFDAFPFPDPAPELRGRIGAVAEHLDAHRKAAIARDERVTMTSMYNVVEKLRSREALTPRERAIHEVAACGVLKDLHDELDALVAEAYGWPWPMEREEILERLVALHAERVAEERAGRVRWLRPDYQIPRYGPQGAVQAEAELEDGAGEAEPEGADRLPWPATAVEQLAAVKEAAERVGADAQVVLAAFEDADARLVARHLETLVVMGEV